MRAVVQRVSEARVTVDGVITGEIARGFLVLVCAMEGDTEETATWLARKIAACRIFKDDQDKMNLALSAVAGSVLAVSQFTLAANGCESGNRPGFSAAAEAGLGKTLYEHFCAAMAATGLTVARGVFGADMKVALVNDGPVTIWFDTAAR
ncbi:MAG: D-aminoacyl-tRNA deacylase [Hyphomicrobiales bacterium]